MNLLILAQQLKGSLLLPPRASNLAVDVDQAWNVILWTTTFFFIIVVGAMTWFVFKYRRRTNPSATSTVTHNTPLEIAWTLIPLVILIIFFFVGFLGFVNYDNPRSDSTIIDVEGKKWNFQFTYPNGAISDTLYVEKDKPVRLNLHSIDVMHGFHIPAFRIQRDLVPFRQTVLWFIPTTFSPPPNPTHNDPGGFFIFCNQYCGDGHSKMYTRVHVLDPAAYAQKMTELANPFKEKVNGKDVYVQYKDLGHKLYLQMGCATCHTVDGKNSTGPTWQGLWKRDHTFSVTHEPGYTLKASDDDAKWVDYLTRSMLTPSADVVAGFQNQMPSFAAQLSGGAPDAHGFIANDEKRRAIQEYIKSLGNEGYKPVADRTTQPDLFDAEKNPVHPESLAAQKAKAPVQ